MIIRHWRGWTRPEHADEYERLLHKEIFPQLRYRGGENLQGIELLRRRDVSEVEFITMLRFSSLKAVKSFNGRDYESAIVPEAARRLLSRFEERARHYEVSAASA